MIKVFIQNDENRVAPLAASTATVREILEANGFNYASASWSLDGTMLVNGAIDKTLEQLGVTADHCYLNSVAHKNNA